MIRANQSLRCSSVRSFKRRHRHAISGIPGLIRHYTMDRYSGTTLYDETGTGNATINNMSIGSGVIGASFEGGSVASTTRNIDMGSELTFASFSLWVKRLDLANQTGMVWNQAATRAVCIRDSGNGNVIGVYGGSFSNTEHVISDIVNWHHVAGVIESANNIRIYLDGVKSAATHAINTSVMRYVGRPGTTASQEAGCYDNFRLYNTILTEGQILELFNEYR